MKNILRKDHMRRNLQRHSKFNITGFFKTRKGKYGDNWLFFESYLEYDHLNMFEYDSTVKIIESQPISIRYTWKGKKRNYSADAGIRQIGKEGPINKYIEIKPSSVMQQEDEKSRFKRIKHVFEQEGYLFDVLTEEDLLPKQHLKNIEILNKSIGCIESSSPYIDDAISVLPVKIKLGEAIRAFNALNISTEVLSYLLYNQIYQFDMNLPLHADVVLTKNIQ